MELHESPSVLMYMQWITLFFGILISFIFIDYGYWRFIGYVPWLFVTMLIVLWWFVPLWDGD